MLAGFKGVLDCIKAFSETDFTEDLKKFDVPTLILHGDDDQIVPIGASAMLSSKLVKGATLKVYPGAPHGMCSTRKDQVNADLLAFLQVVDLLPPRRTRSLAMFETKNDLPEADPRQGGRTAQRAAGRLHRPADAVQAGPLERQGAELHRPARVVRQGQRGRGGLCGRHRRARRAARRRRRGHGPRGGGPEFAARIPGRARRDGRSHVEALSSALAAFGKSARKAIGEANDLGDLDTADLFTEVSRGIDKWLWFVEAHLQAER